MTGKIKPDSLEIHELQQVAQDLTPWLDANTVARLFSTGGADAPTEKSRAAAPLNDPPSAGRTGDNAPPAPFKLQETFAIHRLGAKTIKDPANANKDIAELAKNTWRWHHQIKTDGRPTAFARTCASKQAGAYDVCQFFVSNLSGRIDEAITWIDKYEAAHPEYAETDPLVRLLVVPAYNVLAFWLLKQKTGQSDLLVISALPRMVELKRDRLLSSAEFLQAFAAHGPITGVVFNGDDLSEEEAAERGAYADSGTYDSNALIQPTTLKGGDRMSDQGDVTKDNAGTKGGTNAGASPDANAGAGVALDKTIFDMPNAQGETILFVGQVFGATRSKGAIEEAMHKPGDPGPGAPLYSAFVFPYVPPKQPAGSGGSTAAVPVGPKKEQPLFVAYVFPFLEPERVQLGGGKPGSMSEVGGHPGQTLFYAKIKSFVADKDDKKTDGSGSNT